MSDTQNTNDGVVVAEEEVAVEVAPAEVAAPAEAEVVVEATPEVTA